MNTSSLEGSVDELRAQLDITHSYSEFKPIEDRLLQTAKDDQAPTTQPTPIITDSFRDIGALKESPELEDRAQEDQHEEGDFVLVEGGGVVPEDLPTAGQPLRVRSAPHSRRYSL